MIIHSFLSGMDGPVIHLNVFLIVDLLRVVGKTFIHPQSLNRLPWDISS